MIFRKYSKGLLKVQYCNEALGGGFKNCLFHPYLGEIPFWPIFFKRVVPTNQLEFHMYLSQGHAIAFVKNIKAKRQVEETKSPLA